MREVINLILLLVLVLVGPSVPIAYYSALTGITLIGLYNLYKFITFKIWLRKINYDN